MQLKRLVILCASMLTSLSQAQNVFNNNPQPIDNSNLYGDPTVVHSPEYYNNLITTQNNQAYQAIVTANKANQNDSSLTALQQKIVNGTNNQPLETNNQTQPPSNPSPVNPPSPQIVVPPQPNIIYQTPVSGTANNNTATNLGSSGSNSNSSSSSNSGGGNLDIQY